MVQYRKNVNISAPLYVLWTGEECSRAWRPRLEPASVSCQVRSLGRGVWGTLAFSLLRGFVYMAKGLCSVSSAHSNLTHIGLHHKGPEETRFLFFLYFRQTEPRVYFLWYIYYYLNDKIHSWPKQKLMSAKGHLVHSDISALRPSKCFDMSLQGIWWKGQWHTVTIPPLL